ncbi:MULTISPECIES: hypothetical protein [unclassified Acinetobacter]|uniref:hypothetical protein n=1 Tax=unclassified Acinetobacter TaxID=196816 RepID=UPI001C5532B1|nr:MULTISPECIES: hypothetical protein [unclassified Acinetobacter]UUS65713.1 hypothetical protein MST18_02890 [Acinetobacter sp. YH12068_T]
MHEYLKFFGTNNQQETVRFLIYERGLMTMDTVNNACIYPEDRFNLYSILLAASSMKKPMSEKEAAIFIEQNYLNNGRNQTNATQREKIYTNLGLLK